MKPDISIKAYILDATYGAPDDVEWETASAKFKEDLQREYRLPFDYIDIGTGASQPAFVTVIFEYAPIAAIALFFAGKKIEENYEAWARIFAKMQRFLKPGTRFDRDGSAVIAVAALQQKAGVDLKSLRLVGYTTKSLLVDPFETIAANDDPLELIEPPLDRMRSDTVHVFEFDVGGKRMKVFVHGLEVRMLFHD